MPLASGPFAGFTLTLRIPACVPLVLSSKSQVSGGGVLAVQESAAPLFIVIVSGWGAIVAPLIPEKDRLVWLVWMAGAATVSETLTVAALLPEVKVTVPL